jgi:hypothetical protein
MMVFWVLPSERNSNQPVYGGILFPRKFLDAVRTQNTVIRYIIIAVM